MALNVFAVGFTALIVGRELFLPFLEFETECLGLIDRPYIGSQVEDGHFGVIVWEILWSEHQETTE